MMLRNIVTVEIGKTNRRCWRLRQSSFPRNTSGAAAIEFALIAIPFFALLFATLEIGLFHFYSSQLQMAAELASRELMTGSLASGTTLQKFVDTKLCQKGGLLGVFANCNDLLRVDIGSPDSWKSADVANNYLGYGNDRQKVIVPPAPGRIGVLRIGYPLPEFGGFIGAEQTGVVTYNGQRVRMIIGVAAFRVEK